MTRTRVTRWTPSLGDALRLALRPALTYFGFCLLGSIVLVLTSAFYSSGGDDTLLFFLALGAGLVGIVLGQLLSLLRLRAFPIFVATGISATIVFWIFASAHPPGSEYIGIPLAFFFMAFPCGLLSLMHRYELLASFWPAVGFIGGVFVILNHENRVHVWEESKVSAWLPIPLAYLGAFLVLWLLYLAAKQAMRVELWQALSGAADRRITKRDVARGARVGALPRKNLLPILVLAALLFAGTAILGPYLWRTGKGDREGGREHDAQHQEDGPKPPKVDGEGVIKVLQQMAQAAKETLPKLWPLLFLLLLYRPAKRALLLTHLKAPIIPTPPSERIDNLWEYIRIAAEDAGVVPTSADSINQLLQRMEATGRGSPALGRAAEIYARTRYGFTVGRGDPAAMRIHATEAATLLRKNLGPWKRVTNLWRPLA
jgi:hypothetical protein